MAIKIHPIDDIHRGFCECCGHIVCPNDPEMSRCPARHLSDHSDEMRRAVRSMVEDQRPGTAEDLIAIQEKIRNNR